MQIILTETAKQLEKDFSTEQDKVSFIPSRATLHSAGYDIRACIETSVRILPGKTAFIPLGFHCHIADSSVAALILPRSGLGSKEGIVLGNSVGLIDADYQNEWMCAIWNRNEIKVIHIHPAMKLAQFIFVPVLTPELEIVEEFTEETERKGGFVSTDEDRKEAKKFDDVLLASAKEKK